MVPPLSAGCCRYLPFAYLVSPGGRLFLAVFNMFGGGWSWERQRFATLVCRHPQACFFFLLIALLLWWCLCWVWEALFSVVTVAPLVKNNQECELLGLSRVGRGCSRVFGSTFRLKTIFLIFLKTSKTREQEIIRLSVSYVARDASRGHRCA